MVDQTSDPALIDDQLESWVPGLPFPLASVLWAYLAERDIRERSEQLFHFIEVAARLVGIIGLSGLRTNRALYLAARPSLQGQSGQPSVLFLRATLGNWVNLDLAIAKALRSLEDSQIREIFRVESAGRIAPLMSRELRELLQESLKLRNDWRGHDAVTSPGERSRRLQRLQSIALRFKSVTALLFDRWLLVKPGSATYAAGTYHYTVELLVGSQVPFRQLGVNVSSPLERDGLYFLERGAGTGLQLAPFLQVLSTKDGAQDACYFHDRVEAGTSRWLSYHFEAEPERYEPIDQNLLNIISDLDEPNEDADAGGVGSVGQVAIESGQLSVATVDPSEPFGRNVARPHPTRLRGARLASAAYETARELDADRVGLDVASMIAGLENRSISISGDSPYRTLYTALDTASHQFDHQRGGRFRWKPGAEELATILDAVSGRQLAAIAWEVARTIDPERRGVRSQELRDAVEQSGAVIRGPDPNKTIARAVGQARNRFAHTSSSSFVWPWHVRFREGLASRGGQPGPRDYRGISLGIERV